MQVDQIDHSRDTLIRNFPIRRAAASFKSIQSAVLENSICTKMIRQVNQTLETSPFQNSQIAAGHNLGNVVAGRSSIRHFAPEPPIPEANIRSIGNTFQRYRDFKFARRRHFAMAIHYLGYEITVIPLDPEPH